MGIKDLPPHDGSSFGLEFNYSVWTPGTTVQLCNVPWASDYRDVVYFSTQAKLDEYLTNNAGPSVSFSGLTYAKPGNPVRISLPFNAAYKFNYLRVHNATQPVSGDSPRTFYYFINDVRYVAPNTTELHIQLDVWQTFHRNASFGNCYIERGHIGIANENQFNDYGREYLTVPEGLDVGGEYRIIRSYKKDIAAINTGDNPGVAILVTSTVSLTDSGGDVNAPKLSTANGSSFEGIPNGAELYYFDSVGQFRSFMSAFSQKPWITQGILSITAIPKITAWTVDGVQVADDIVLDGMVTPVKKLIQGSVHNKKHNLASNFRGEVAEQLADRYKHLKKFQVYPYTVVELTSYTGTPLILKPESMGGANIEVLQLTHLAPPSPRIAFIPYKYNSTAGMIDEVSSAGEIVNDNAEFLDMQTGIFNFPQFSLVNNGYLTYMAANSHSIAYQQQAADWSQTRALAGNSLAFDQASAGMGLAQTLNRNQVSAATQTTALANTTAGYRALQGGVNGAIGGVAQGGPAGVASGALAAANSAVDYAIQTNQNNQQLGINTGLANAQTRAGVENQGYLRDTNRAYADFAARGDYENAIAAINAKVQDARMIQPTTVGQVGGDAFNLVTFKWGVYAKVKTLQQAMIHVIGEYWLRYGYAINRFGRMPINYQVMTRFTYWKLRETYITSSTCPEMFKQTLRGIFEKGVTVWNNASDIGNIDIADNDPLPGVRL